MKHAFLDKYAGLESPVHQLDARAKIVTFFALIVIAVTTPPDAWAAFLGYGAFLVLIAAASRVPPGYVLRRAWVILPFLAMVALSIPFLKPGGVAPALHSLSGGGPARRSLRAKAGPREPPCCRSFPLWQTPHRLWLAGKSALAFCLFSCVCGGGAASLDGQPSAKLSARRAGGEI